MHGSATNTDEYLKGIPEWQRGNLTLFRKLIHKVSPDITEEIKWGVPVFMQDKKLVFAMSSFKAHTKYNFITNGALLADPHKLFNNGFDSKKSRGIDLLEGQSIDKFALEDLVKQSLKTI